MSGDSRLTAETPAADRKKHGATSPTLDPPHVPRGLVYTVMFLLFVIWSNSFHAVTYFRTTLHVSAFDLATMRFGPVALFCIPYCLWRWRETRAIFARDGLRVVLMAMCMVPFYNLALNWGQGRVPPATASLIITMNPVFTLLLAVAFLGEKLRWSRVFGFVVAFLGVYLLVRTQRGSFGSGYELYALVVLLAPLSWAIAAVLGKPATSRGDPMLLSITATGLGSLPFLGTMILGTGGVNTILRDLSLTGWGALMHLSILCTIVGFAAYFWALGKLPASSVSAFVFLNPPLTAAFGALWRTEAFHWSTVVYGSVTLAGVALSSGVLTRGGRGPDGLARAQS
jgi:drug/metabolite transporter (DMT)-like permease